VAFWKGVGLEQKKLLKPFQEVVLAGILPPPQCIRRDGIRARRAAEPEIDATGKQRLTLKRSAAISGAWFGNMTPPEPTRMRSVAAAICPIMISGVELAIDGRLWCSATQ
jgi:hypothetical protein